MPVTSTEIEAVRDYVQNFEGQPHIQLAILGAGRVGKRSFQQRLNWERFLDSYDPFQNDQFQMRMEVGSKLVYYDGTMLAPPYSAVDYPKGYLSDYNSLRHVEAVIFMYDVGSRESFDEIKRYYENFVLERSAQARSPCTLECSPVCGPRPAPYPGLLWVLANKIDRAQGDWTVGIDEGKAFAESVGAIFSSISAKTGEGSGRERLEDMTMRTLLTRVHTLSVGGDEGAVSTIRTRNGTAQRNGRFWY